MFTVTVFSGAWPARRNFGAEPTTSGLARCDVSLRDGPFPRRCGGDFRIGLCGDVGGRVHRVGEFHYLHNDTNGQRYDNIAEMAERIGAAAQATGIGLTLVPVLYERGGFDGRAPNSAQRRFCKTMDQFQNLMAEIRGRRPPA